MRLAMLYAVDASCTSCNYMLHAATALTSFMAMSR